MHSITYVVNMSQKKSIYFAFVNNDILLIEMAPNVLILSNTSNVSFRCKRINRKGENVTNFVRFYNILISYSRRKVFS